MLLYAWTLIIFMADNLSPEIHHKWHLVSIILLMVALQLSNVIILILIFLYSLTTLVE